MVDREHVVSQGFSVAVENPRAIYNFAVSQVPFLTSVDDQIDLVRESSNGLIGDITNDVRFKNGAFRELLSETMFNDRFFDEEITHLNIHHNPGSSPHVHVATALLRSDEALATAPHFTIPMLERVEKRLNARQKKAKLVCNGLSAAIGLGDTDPRAMMASFGNPGVVNTRDFSRGETRFFLGETGSMLLTHARKEAARGVKNVRFSSTFFLENPTLFEKEMKEYASNYQVLVEELYRESGEIPPVLTVLLRSPHALTTRLTLE